MPALLHKTGSHSMEGNIYLVTIPTLSLGIFIAISIIKSSQNKKEQAKKLEKETLYKTAISAFKAENYEEAHEALTLYVDKDKSNAEAFYHRGIINHFHHADYYEAISDFNNAIKLKNDKSLYYYKRGLSKEALKNYAHATEDFEKAIELDSKSTEAILSYYEMSIIKLRKCVSAKEGNIAPEVESDLTEARLKYMA